MEIGIIFKVAAVGIIVALLQQILSRSGRDEYAMITTLAGLLVVIMMLIPHIAELFSSVKTVFTF